MKQYMLDTNAVSHFIRKHPALSRRVKATPITSICMSAITKGELLYGLAKHTTTKWLDSAVWELLRRVDVLPWDGTSAEYYGVVRANMERQGKTIAPLDMLIAAHALSIGAVLVTNDKAFGQVADLLVEDWTD